MIIWENNENKITNFNKLETYIIKLKNNYINTELSQLILNTYNLSSKEIVEIYNHLLMQYKNLNTKYIKLYQITERLYNENKELKSKYKKFETNSTRKIDEQICNEVKQMLKNKKSYNYISKKLHISSKTIKKIKDGKYD